MADTEPFPKLVHATSNIKRAIPNGIIALRCILPSCNRAKKLSHVKYFACNLFAESHDAHELGKMAPNHVPVQEKISFRFGRCVRHCASYCIDITMASRSVSSYDFIARCHRVIYLWYVQLGLTNKYCHWIIFIKVKSKGENGKPIEIWTEPASHNERCRTQRLKMNVEWWQHGKSWSEGDHPNKWIRLVSETTFQTTDELIHEKRLD